MSPAAKYRLGTGEMPLGKEWKTASSRHFVTGVGNPVNAYNPGTGTFHALDRSLPDGIGSGHSGRFRSIDEVDDLASAVGSYSEYDSVSNNGSCSGESEDQPQSLTGKEKKGQPPGFVGGGGSGGGGSDKRDKIRHKNEKKHQRQKERRAQELRDRCTAYLMSRKMEALAQQLVAMGFSHDRATMALIFNDGDVERSVAWLLEGGEGEVKDDWNAEDGKFKLDISDELARIADLELRFKYSRVELERAVVACEGDVNKAAEWLRERHPQAALSAPEYGSHRLQERGKEPYSAAAAATPYLSAVQEGGNELYHALINHQRREEREPHSAPPLRAGAYQPLLTRSPYQPLEGAFPVARGGIDSQRLSSSIEGLYRPNGTRNTSQTVPVSYQPGRSVLVESRAPPPPPLENGSASRRDQNFHLPSRDPFVTLQHPQSPISPPGHTRSGSGSPSMSPPGWNGGTATAAGVSSPSSVLFFDGNAGDMLFKGATTGKSTGEVFANKRSEAPAVHPSRNDVPGSSVWGSGGAFGGRDGPLPSAASAPSPPSTSHLRTQSTPKFLSGWGSGLPGDRANWSMWISGGCDYRNIDWSMGASPSNVSDAGVWGISSNFASMLNLADGGKPRQGLAGGGSSHTYPGDRDDSSSAFDYHLWTSTSAGNAGDLGLHEKPDNDSGNSTGMGVVPEWTSPFAGKDLFTPPQQAVPSTLL